MPDALPHSAFAPITRPKAPHLSRPAIVDRDAIASWRAMPPGIKLDVCAQAGVPDAADAASLAWLTLEQRTALGVYVRSTRDGLHPSAWGLSNL